MADPSKPIPRKPIPWSDIVTYVVLSLGAVLAIIPFLWMFSWSLMAHADVIRGEVIPTDPRWGNYVEAWETAKFSQYMWNSIRITAIAVFGTLLFSVPAAYAFARMRFWGRDVIFTVMLATLMIPDIVTLIPNYLTVIWISRFSQALFGEAGAWINNWPALTVPFFASAFTIFLLRQFFQQIPEDLWDAARMDGASHLGFMLRVVIPLSRAPIMTIVTFTFIGSWNALLWPILVANTDDWRPIAYGLTKFVEADAGSDFQLQMAASVITIIPILILYFFTQKQFTEGIYAGSFK